MLFSRYIVMLPAALPLIMSAPTNMGNALTQLSFIYLSLIPQQVLKW